MKNTILTRLVVVALLAASALGQALNPSEVKNPAMRALQEKYFAQLQGVADEVHAHVFPNSFYASRVLDLDLAHQEKADQRSLRFDNYKGKTVIELTGNYFAAYLEDEMDKQHRAAATCQDVMLPILQIAVPALQDIPEVDGFALEISHQVRKKTAGGVREHPENLVIILDRDAAVRLVSARTDRDRQAALLEGQTFVNAEQFVLALRDDLGKPQIEDSDAPTYARREKGASWTLAKATNFPGMPSSAKGAPATTPSPTVRDTSREALSAIQASLQATIDKIVSEMDGQASFVHYAPPSVVSFRKGAYLEFSVNPKLVGTATGSRYKLAALAFDDHIAHLMRPITFQFQGGDIPIDGIAFSTTFRADTVASVPAGQSGKGDSTQAVEFFFPLESLRCYESYDCTGQQLLDAGSILIDGERVSLNLQTAEADTR